jgi:hypothetical protein
VSIDGTRKWREEGYTREWPEPCRTGPEVAARAEALLTELGLGARRTRDVATNGVHGGGAFERVLGAARELLGRARP